MELGFLTIFHAIIEHAWGGFSISDGSLSNNQGSKECESDFCRFCMLASTNSWIAVEFDWFFMEKSIG